MTHAEMNELYELYVLGSLEPAEAAEIDEHVRTGCDYCLQRLQDALAVTSAMCGLAEPQTPPRRLRGRILAAVKPQKRSQAWIFALAGLSAACAALIVFSVWSATNMDRYRAHAAELEAQRNQLRSAVEILSRSETRTVQFGHANNQPRGRVFVNPQQGLVFVGSQLPQLASDQTFQLWLIPASGAPESAGLFRPNAAGNFVDVRTTPVDTTRIQAVAVSVEPPGGSPAPTTKPILVVPLG
ncbi:MAG TPA: anti-sigma factor [Bryobacteraceae bacterium]|nr:anti-sigma factor [Bryobacteraceae bacterium]